MNIVQMFETFKGLHIDLLGYCQHGRYGSISIWLSVGAPHNHPRTHTQGYILYGPCKSDASPMQVLHGQFDQVKLAAVSFSPSFLAMEGTASEKEVFVGIRGGHTRDEGTV